MVKGDFYNIFGVSLAASSQEIQDRYRELSLAHHSDKGGDGEEFKKITNAYEVLGNPHKRSKYDLGLLKNGNLDFAEYIEPENDIYQPNEVVTDELVWRIAALLQEELKINNLDEEELSKYGQKNHPVVLEKGSFGEVKKIIIFCREKLKGKKFLTVIENARSYLETIEDSCWDKGEVFTAVEEIMPEEELSDNPLLTRKELDDYEEHNEYNSYYEKVKEEVLRKTSSANRKEGIEKHKESFKNIVKPLKEKINQRREKKKALLNELDDWLEDGEKILTDEAENKQEKIANFINDFSDYLDLMKENADYPIKVINQNIQKDKNGEINSLITRLENWKEEEEVHDEGEEEFNNPSPISNEVKKEFIKYLDDLLFDWLAPSGTPRSPTSLKRIRNNHSLVYEEGLKNASNKGEAEITRANVIKSICEIVSNTGGSDEDLVKKVRKININFIYKISSEIEKQLGIKISNLPQEEQDLLFKPKKGELSQVGFAKKIIRRKAKILENNIRISWQIKAISEVNDYWTNNQTGGRINEQTKEEILGTNWENKVRAKSTEDEINNERDNLKNLVNNAKALGTVKKWQDIAIEEVEKHWKTNSDDGKLSGKINQQTIGQVLGKANWQESIRNKNTENEISNCKNYFKDLINKSKSDEIEIKARGTYDDLLRKIENETDPNADYTQRINKLDWSLLTSLQTKDALINAWSNRKKHLVDMARREQERSGGQSQQQAEKERLENEKEKQIYQELKDRIEKVNEYDDYTSFFLLELEIEDLQQENWRTELWELLKKKRREWKQNHSEEGKLNKYLKEFRNASLFSRMLSKGKEIVRWENFISKSIEKWFSELEEFLRKHDYHFLKKICGEISEDKKEEVFSQFFSELKKERNEIKRRKDFDKSAYFKNVKKNEVREYVREIFRNVYKQIEEEDAEWKKGVEGDINSIMKEAEKIEEEFFSNVKTSQEKIKKVIEKLSRSIVNKTKKSEEDLINEKKVMDSITNLVEKIEEVMEAVEVAKEVISSYLEGKNLSKEETKKWLSKLEREFENSKQVAQYFQKIISEVNQGNQGNQGNVSNVLVVIGLISISGFLLVLLLKKWLGKKFKK